MQADSTQPSVIEFADALRRARSYVDHVSLIQALRIDDLLDRFDAEEARLRDAIVEEVRQTLLCRNGILRLSQLNAALEAREAQRATPARSEA